MPGDFCDWAPCSLLQKFVVELLPKNRREGTVEGFIVVPPMKANSRPEPPKRVTFYYCPFCGTRLSENKEILGWIQKRRGSPT